MYARAWIELSAVNRHIAFHLLNLLLLLTSSVARSTQESIKLPAFMRINRCYSCMSPVYEELFKEGYLSKYFYEPRNFSSHCDEPFDPRGIGLIPCRSICLTLTQDFVVMGRKTGRKLTMRGCSTTLSRSGFYNRTLTMFDQYDMCREIPATDLFRYDTDTQLIRVCSCLGDRCNGSSANDCRANVSLLLFILSCLTVLSATTR